MDCIHANTGPPRDIFEKTSEDLSAIGGGSSNAALE